MEVTKKCQFVFFIISLSFYVFMYIHVKSVLDPEKTKMKKISNEEHQLPDKRINLNWIGPSVKYSSVFF